MKALKLTPLGDPEPKQLSFNDVNSLSNSDSCSTKITETGFNVETEEYEIIKEEEYGEDFEFINLPDEREIHDLPHEEENIVEIRVLIRKSC